MKKCPICKIDKELSEYYNSKSRPSGAGMCKKCFNEYCIKRWVQRKIEAIKYKGNKCEDCSLHIKDSHYSVFEFHHLVPTLKDIDWTKLRLKSQSSINKELDKCALLCANCHRIRHANKD